jgi:hypothetical protein
MPADNEIRMEMMVHASMLMNILCDTSKVRTYLA